MATITESLAGRLFLLGVDVKGEHGPSGVAAPHLLRAAALEELRLDGLVADDGGGAGAGAKVGLAAAGEPAEPVTAALLAEIGASERARSWTWWVRHGELATAEAVRDGLVAAGTIEVSRDRILGILPRTHVRVADPAALAALRARVRELATGEAPEDQLDPRDAALVALVAAADMDSVLVPRERRAAKARLARIVDRAGPVPLALRKVVRDKRAAAGGGSTAAVVAATAATSGGC